MRQAQAGSTNQSVELKIVGENGADRNNVAYDTASLELWYWRPGGTKQPITPAELTGLNDAHDDGGIILIGDGVYRLDLPDAAVAAGVDRVVWGGSVPDGIIMGGAMQLVVHNPIDLYAMAQAACEAAINEPQAESYPAHGGPASLNQLQWAQYSTLINTIRNDLELVVRRQNGTQAMKLMMNHAETPTEVSRTE